MELKGNWDSGTSYNVGDVVNYDDVFYLLQTSAPAGATPHDTLYWVRMGEPLASACKLIMDGISMAVTTATASIPTNINEEAITLKGSGDNEYLITVDDSGDTPELDVTLIEEEEET